jgi:nucleoside-diphosphate-sugar epimerase
MEVKDVKKILVAGAGGFIGSHMVKYLKDRDYWVRGVDVKKPEFMKSYADELMLMDLRNEKNTSRITRGVEQVYSFAANMGGIGFISRVKADVMHDNVLINANMLKACVENNVGKIFFSSSACIYPHQLQKDDSHIADLKELDAYPAQPGTPYGWEKLFAEIMCRSFEEDYGLRTRIARYHNIYGPEGTFKGGREKAPAALCRKVAMAEDGGSIIIWGNGKQIRSFLYINDCLEATRLLMESDCKEPLNIGSDQAITIDELADMIIGISGKNIEKEYDLTKPVGVRSRNADITLLRKKLNWQPKVSYREGLEKTYRWVEEQVKR